MQCFVQGCLWQKLFAPFRKTGINSQTSPEIFIPKVSVIIVNYNAGPWLERCVQSVCEQSVREFECFIIDNGSTDTSLKKLPKLDSRFKVIKLGDNTGFAHANNIGAKQASSPWIALLNPDAFADPDWLENMLAATTLTPHIKMVGALQYMADTNREILDGFGDCYHISGIAYRGGHKHKTNPPKTGLAFGPCAAAALYDRDWFLKLGGFDERFFCYHEDVDMAFRIQLAGGMCVQSRDAIVEHVGSATSRQTPDFAIYHGTRNRIWTFFKNMPLPLLILFLPFHISANLAYLLWALFRKNRFKPTLRGIIDGLKGLPLTLRARKSVQKHRVIGLWTLLKKFTYSPLKVLTRAIHIKDVSY